MRGVSNLGRTKVKKNDTNMADPNLSIATYFTVNERRIHRKLQIENCQSQIESETRPALDVLHHLRVEQRGGVAQIGNVTFSDLPEYSAHDLA
jgi:hypothetical protein